MNDLVKVDWNGFDRQIERASDPSEIARLYAAMEAVKVLAKERKMGLASINKAGAFMAKLAVKAAEKYEGLVDMPGKRTDLVHHVDEVTTKQQGAKALGKTREMLGRWGKLREKVKDEPAKIDAYYAQATANNKEGSIAGLYREQIKKPYEFHYNELPDGKYHVIYSDPPWYISDSEWETKWGGEVNTINAKYDRVKSEDLCKLPVKEKAGDSCVLFLWTTHTFLPDSFGVAQAWGFKYNSLITWGKGSGWTTQKFHRSTELCLYCLRGPINYKGDAFPALIQEKRTTHSTKPQLMRKLIEDRIPEPRLELFAREEHAGWVSWGDQL